MFGKVDYVMVNVSDMGRSVAFYRDTLGLRLKFESPGWSEFETGATTLALHGATRPAAGDPAAGPVAGTCRLGFSVPDLNSTYAELRKRGVHFVMPPTEQPNEGIRLAGCVDPDGLAISFAEPLPREAPSPA
jgi:lactoylglutathione lyase